MPWNQTKSFIYEIPLVGLVIALSLGIFRIFPRCTDLLPVTNSECVAAFGPSIGVSLIAAILLLTVLCRNKNVRQWWVYFILQWFGFIAMTGVLKAPWYSLINCLVPFVYVILLTMIAAYKTRGSKMLVFSTVHTLVLSILFVFILINTKSQNTNPIVFLRFVPASVGGLYAGVAATFSSLFLNIWTKRHSVIVYLLILVSLLFSSIITVPLIAIARFHILHGGN